MAFHNIEPSRSGRTAGARKSDRCGRLIGFKISQNPPEIHRRGVANLTRSYRVSPIAAGVVASSAYGEVAR